MGISEGKLRPAIGILSTHLKFDTFLLWIQFSPPWPEGLRLSPLVSLEPWGTQELP